MENNNTQYKITVEFDDYKLTLNHEDLSNDHIIEFLEWSIRVLEVRDAKRAKKSFERLIYAFKAMSSLEKSLDEQAEGERISHNPEPDKNIFNKIGLEFIKFENQMKELGIDPKKFGVNEFLNSICKVVKENLKST